MSCLNKSSIYLRNTGDADKPVLSGRQPISALGQVPSTKGLEKDQGRQRERKGVAVQKGMSATMLHEISALTFGSDEFLFPVLSLSEYKLDVLRQRMRKETIQAALRGRDGRGIWVAARWAVRGVVLNVTAGVAIVCNMSLGKQT